MSRKKQYEEQAQVFVDAMCKKLSTELSCQIYYNQFSPHLGIINQQSSLHSHASTDPDNLVCAETSALHQQISTLYFTEFFPHFEAVALPRAYNPAQGAISEHGNIVSLTSEFDFTETLLILPIFGPLNHMAVFIINSAHALTQGRSFESKALLSKIYVAAQNCHKQTLTETILAEPTSLQKLTPRELEILTWISRGKSNSVIAELLELSQHTVTGYIRNIYLKTQTNDRTSAAVYALSSGLLHDSSVRRRMR